MVGLWLYDVIWSDFSHKLLVLNAIFMTSLGLCRDSRQSEILLLIGAGVCADAIGPASLARENEAGAVGGRRSIYSMLTYRTLFCFGRNNRTVPK